MRSWSLVGSEGCLYNLPSIMEDALTFLALIQFLIDLFLQGFGILDKLVDIILVDLIIICIQLTELTFIFGIY